MRVKGLILSYYKKSRHLLSSHILLSLAILVIILWIWSGSLSSLAIAHAANLLQQPEQSVVPHHYKRTNHLNRTTMPRKMEIALPRNHRVILNTYMRAGSTFALQVFQSYENSFVIFEPLHYICGPVYANKAYCELMWGIMFGDLDTPSSLPPREFTAVEKELISSHVRKMSTCQFELLPVDYIFDFFHFVFNKQLRDLQCEQKAQIFFGTTKAPHCYDYISKHCRRLGDTKAAAAARCSQLMLDLETKSKVAANLKVPFEQQTWKKDLELYQKCEQGYKWVWSDCIDRMKQKCTAAPVVALKIIRLSTKFWNFYTNKYPDTKVIHMSRDPRAIVASRSNIELHTRPNQPLEERIKQEGNVLCRQMLADFEELEKDEEAVGHIIGIKYDDLVINSNETVNKIYEFMGTSAPDYLLEDMWFRTHAGQQGQGGAFALVRSDASKHLNKWMQTLSGDVKSYLSDTCAQVLKTGHWDIAPS